MEYDRPEQLQIWSCRRCCCCCRIHVGKVVADSHTTTLVETAAAVVDTAIGLAAAVFQDWAAPGELERRAAVDL